MNEAELKKCPFCGEIPKLIHISRNGKDGSQIVCSNCCVVGKWFSVSHTYSSDDRAIEAWNKRTDNEPSVEIVRCEDCVHWKLDKNSYQSLYGLCKLNSRTRTCSFFCASGKRRING